MVGTPIAGWSISNPNLTWMIWGNPPLSFMNPLISSVEPKDLKSSFISADAPHAFQAVSDPVPWPFGPRRNAADACLTHLAARRRSRSGGDSRRISGGQNGGHKMARKEKESKGKLMKKSSSGFRGRLFSDKA